MNAPEVVQQLHASGAASVLGQLAQREEVAVFFHADLTLHPGQVDAWVWVWLWLWVGVGGAGQSTSSLGGRHDFIEVPSNSG